MLNYRWLQEASLRAIYSSVPAYSPVPVMHIPPQSKSVNLPILHTPAPTFTHLTHCQALAICPMCLFLPQYSGHCHTVSCLLLFPPFSVGCLSLHVSHFFIKLPCPALVHTSSFLPWTPLYATFVFSVPPSSPIPNQGTNSNAKRSTFLGKMSRGGRGHSGSTTGNVKVPQLLSSSAAPAGTPTAL